MKNDTRERFKNYLIENKCEEAEQWVSIVDFSLKVLLHAVGELKEDEEVYDVTEFERVEEWRDKIRSDAQWQRIDLQNHGKPSKALRLYRNFIERSDLELNSAKRLSRVKTKIGSDDRIELLPGITVSKKQHTIFIDSDENQDLMEGTASKAHATRYERSRLARQLCIASYGSTYRCEVCGDRLSDRYGHRAGKADYIEVHHIIGHADESRKRGEHEVNYKRDLIPLCPNCHRMIHHLKDHTLHPDELRTIIATHERKGQTT